MSADLETNSAALRYVLRECGKENVFSLRPKVGEILTIPPDINPNPNQSIHLLIIRANQRAPLLTDDYLRCMTHLIQRLIEKGSTPTYTGSRATRPFIGKPVPYPNEFAGGHWYSRGAA